MKTIIFIIIISFAFLPAHAQLSNSKWKVTLSVPDPTDIVFDFRADTVDAVSAESNETIETMLYTVKDTVLTLQKITGGSECDNDVIGKYKFEMKDDGMYLTLIEDACEDRANVLNNKEKWVKTQ
jgi:hypothetical protein